MTPDEIRRLAQLPDASLSKAMLRDAVIALLGMIDGDAADKPAGNAAPPQPFSFFKPHGGQA